MILLATLISALLTIVLVFLVYKRSRFTISKQIFIQFGVLLVVLLIVNYFSLIYLSSGIGIWLVRVVMFFAVIQIYLFYKFVYSFPEDTKMPARSSMLLFFVSFTMAILSLSNVVFSKIEIQGSQSYPLPGIGISLFALYSFLLLGLGVCSLFKKYERTTGIKKMQILYVSSGLILMFLLLFTFNFIFVVIFKNSYFISFTSLFIMPFVLATAYAILRYRLMDISIVIRKSVLQIVTFAILFGFYAYVLLVIQRTSTSSISLSDNSTLLIVILIIAATMEPLRRLIYKWIDNLFESKERKQEEVLQRLQFISSSNLHFSKLVETTTKELSRVFGVKTTFSLFEQGTMESQDTSFQLRAGDPLISKFQTGKIFIAEELQYAESTGDSSAKLIFEFMRAHHLQAILPVGKDADFVGAFLFSDTESKIVFTSDKVKFLNKFVSQSQLAFASSLAYKHAIERIKI